uniref:DPPIV_N domain-containing protein n=1 Tax=Panagrellus redivivus TaxID=6233 RepID=A0A7E4VKW8_PANRE
MARMHGALLFLFISCLALVINGEEKVHNLANLQQLTFYESFELPIAFKWGVDDKSVFYQYHNQIYTVSTKEAFPRPRRVSTGLGSNQLVGLKQNGDILYLTDAFRYDNLTAALQRTLRDRAENAKLPYDLITANSLGNLKHKANLTIAKTAFTDPTGKFLIYESDTYFHLINTLDDSEQIIANRSGSDLKLISGAFSRKLNRVAFSVEVGGVVQVYSFTFDYNTGKLDNGTILQESKTQYFWVNDFTPCGKKIVLTTGPDKFNATYLKVYSATDDKDKGTDIGSNGRVFSAVFGASFSNDGKKLAFSKLAGEFSNAVIADWNCDDKENSTPKRGIQMPVEKHVSRKANARHSKYAGMVKRGSNGFEGSEKHLKNVRQLTFGGQNAEGYFAFKTDSFVFQAAGLEEYGTACDQIYRQDFDRTSQTTVKSPPQRLSTGLGSCTCSYFFPDDTHAIYASTFLNIDPAKINDPKIGTCDPKKCQSQQAKTDPILKSLCNTSYTWDLHPGYDIFHVDGEGNFIERLTDTPGYDAEGAISPDGRLMVFTSVRTGDPELWLYNFETKAFKQLTNELGYDGGPFFSPDGTKIGFRASRPKTDADVEKYKKLLSYDLIEPLAMELYTINVDGTGIRQIAKLGNSNWAPFYLIDNQRIIFSSNYNATSFGGFDLYVINDDGTGLEQVTFSKGFDAFPMMSRDGRLLIWGSSRNGKSRTDLNLFLADWVD